MSQDFINWLMAGFGALIGFLLKVTWDSVKDLQTSDKALAEKVSGIEVLVAGNYIQRRELNDLSHALFTKLDRIEEKMDKKADK